MAKLTNQQYRNLKDKLSAYTNFSFKKPPMRKNKDGKKVAKDFTPQQKSAITRASNKYIDNIKTEKKGSSTFIPYKKTKKGTRDLYKGVEGKRTNKGIFIPEKNAEIKTVTVRKGKKARKKKILITTPRKSQFDIYFPFNKYILGSLELIEIFVDELQTKLDPTFVSWSFGGTASKKVYDTEIFNLYLSGDYIDENGDAKKPDKDNFNPSGVVLIWAVNSDAERNKIFRKVSNYLGK